MSAFPKIPETTAVGLFNSNTPTNITRFNRHTVMKQNAVTSAPRKFIYHRNKQSQSNVTRKLINESFQSSAQQSSTNSAFGDSRMHLKNSSNLQRQRTSLKLRAHKKNDSMNLKQVKQNQETQVISQPPQKFESSLQKQSSWLTRNQKINNSLDSDAMIKFKICQTQQLARQIYERGKSPEILKLLSPENQDNSRMISLSPQKLYNENHKQSQKKSSLPLSLFKNKKFTAYSSANSKLLLKIYKSPPLQQKKYGNLNNLDVSIKDTTITQAMTDQARVSQKNSPCLNQTLPSNFNNTDLGASVQIGSLQDFHDTRKARSKSPAGIKHHSSSLSSTSKHNLLRQSSSKFILMPSQSRILPKLVDESLKMGRSPDNLGGSNDILPKKKS